MIMPMDPDAPHPPHARPLRDPQLPVGYGGGGAPLVDSMTAHERPRFTRRGNPIVPSDPGSPGSRILAILAAILLAGIVIVWQNMGPDRQQDLINAPPAPPAAAQAADEPAPGGMTDLMARAFLRLRTFLSPSPETDRRSLVDQVESTAAGDADRVRVIIMAADFLGHDAALERIEDLRTDLLAREAPPEADTPAETQAETQTDLNAPTHRDLLRTELDALETIYTDGPDALEPVARDQLAARYGTLGEFALTAGRPESERTAAIGGPWPILMLGLGVMLLIGTGLLVGFVLLIWGIVWYASPRTVMRGENPAPGGSIMLETYALFVGGFALLSIGSTIAEAHASGPVRDLVIALHLPAQWLLMLTVLWPLVRGMTARHWRQAMGLHRGQGVAREMACGLLVYLASIPLYFLGVALSVFLMIAWNYLKTGGSTEPAPPPENPIIDLVGSGDPLILVLIFTLATVWAPVTEELIFRGALFRHFRGRVHWTLAALGSAVLFAYMHAYGPLMVAPLIALGFMFAFMREWRGSIIAPMTAHFLHNFTLLTVVIIAFQVIG
jgi:membrane protease YdiL (CAAX protease family)